MGNTQHKSKLVKSVSVPPISNNRLERNSNMKQSKSSAFNAISNQHQNYDDLKQSIRIEKNSLRKRLITTLGLKRMKNSPTSQMESSLKEVLNTEIIKQHSITDPNLLLISQKSCNQHDIIDLEIENERLQDNQFLIDVNKKLKTLSQEDDNYSCNSNDSYIDKISIVNSKFSNINRNCSKLSKSPAIFNINYYTNPIKSVDTQVKDLLTEQQYDDEDEDFSSLKNAQLSTNNRQKSLSSASVSISNSSTSSTSNSCQSETLSQMFHYDTFYYIDETVTSSPTSSTRLKHKNLNQQSKSPVMPDYVNKTSAIPWFRFVNAINRQMHMCRSPKKLKQSNTQHLNSNKRPPLKAVDNYYYDIVTIKKIINKELDYDFNDNNSSIYMFDNVQACNNTCSFTSKPSEAPIATFEHMTPLSLSNDYLNKLEFLNSKKSFINNESSHVQIKRFSCLV